MGMADSAAVAGAAGALVALSVAVEAVFAVPLTALRVALGVAISVPAHLRHTTLTARPHPILVAAVTLIPTAPWVVARLITVSVANTVGEAGVVAR